MLKVYFIYDCVSDCWVGSETAKNEKDLVRSLVMGGFFKYNRLEDLKFIVADQDVESIPKGAEVNIMKVVEEMNYKIEPKGEKVADNLEEAKKKILNREVK